MEKDTMSAVDPAIKDNPDDAGVQGFDKDGKEVEPMTTGEMESLKAKEGQDDKEADVDDKEDF